MRDSLPRGTFILKGKKIEGKVKITHSFPAVLMCCVLQGSRDQHYQCIFDGYSPKNFCVSIYKKLHRSYSTSQTVLIVITHSFSQDMFYLILHSEYWTQMKPHETSQLPVLLSAACSWCYRGFGWLHWKWYETGWEQGRTTVSVVASHY